VGPETADAVIKVADGIERVLGPVRTFVEDKLGDKLLADAGGPVVDVPQKVGSLGPLALRQLGYGPGDEVYDRAQEIEQGLDVNPVPLPNQPRSNNEVVIETDPQPDAPGGAGRGEERAVSGVIDP
jgi:hypothetical protein